MEFDMADGTRETTCGHYPYHAKGLCYACYHAAYREANRERINAAGRAYRPSAEIRKRKAARGRARQKANPERAAARQRAWREANPERTRERDRKYYEANAERIRERKRPQDKAWRKANPDLRLNQQHRRRARKAGVEADLTVDQWRDILAAFDGHCAYCDRDDVPLTMEHPVPLSRGGMHTVSNVVPSCLHCNSSKGNKTAEEFLGET